MVDEQTKLPSGDPAAQPQWKTPFGGKMSAGTAETVQGIGNLLTRGGFALLGLGVAQQSGQPAAAPVIASIGGGIADVLQERWWRKEAEFFDEKYTQPYSQMMQQAYQKFQAETSPVTITKEIQEPNEEGKVITRSIPVTGFPTARDPKTGQVTDVIPQNTDQGLAYYANAEQQLNATIANSTIQYLDSTSLPMFRSNPMVSQKAAMIHQSYAKWTGQVTGAFKGQQDLKIGQSKIEANEAKTEESQFNTRILGPLKAQTEIAKAGKYQAGAVASLRGGSGGSGGRKGKFNPRDLKTPTEVFNHITTNPQELASTKALLKEFQITPPKEEAFSDPAKFEAAKERYLAESMKVVGEKMRRYLAVNLQISPVQAEMEIYSDPNTRQYSIINYLEGKYPFLPQEQIVALWNESGGDSAALLKHLNKIAKTNEKAQASAKKEEEKKEPGLISRLGALLDTPIKGK